MKKMQFLGLLVILPMMGYQTAANADCGYNNHVANANDNHQQLLQNMVANSSSGRLRQAHAARNCTITTTLHQNGRACINGSGNNHVTVQTNGMTYHVFDYDNDGEDMVANNLNPNPDDRANLCTTTMIKGQLYRVM